MPLPQDIANLLAIAIRDVIWYKDKVLSFFKDCSVPPILLKQVKKEKEEGMATVKLVHLLLEELDKFGDEGWRVSKTMLTKMVYWKDLHSIAADKRATAEKSLHALRSAMKDYNEQQAFEDRKAREEKEKAQHAERVTRGHIKEIDHSLLQKFRDEFDDIYKMKDEIGKGNRFEALLNKIFAYYNERSEGSFNRTGEQVDGLIYFDKHWYFVEIRWRAEKSNAADVSVLRDRAQRSFGGDTKALFISFNGFSKDCLDAMLGGDHERVILFDGGDLRCVLNCDIPFDILLAEKQVELVKNKRPFVSAFEIIARRSNTSAKP
jgi:hypothetical protein